MKVEVGDKIPDWVMESVRPERMRTMAAILRDPNPVHWDRATCKSMGFGDHTINQGPLGLKSLYQSAGLPPELYPAFRAAVDVANQTQHDGEEHDRERFARRVLERIMTQVEQIGDNMGSENMEYLLAKLDRLGGTVSAAA